MNRSLPPAAMIAAGLMLGGPASAAKLCKLTGTYKDAFGLATATIKGRAGLLAAPDACATPYKLKITGLTTTGFTVTGTNKTASCGTFSAMPMFESSCSVFGGSVTIRGETFSDTFTKQAPARPATIDAPKLTDGLQ